MAARKHSFLSAILWISTFLPFFCWSGQTGKIVGRVMDAETGETLPGANIYLQNTILGAAADEDGDFIILNVPPGRYTVIAAMLGYREMHQENIRVAVDRTTRLDFRLIPATIEAEAVIVEAKQPLIQKDLTASSLSVSSEEIKLLPVETFQDVLTLQAGVVEDSQGDLHIRGGRASEIAYLVDGVSVTDPYSGKLAVDLDQSAIQEVKVISGTFNAEYGQVMSGVVEVVTKNPETTLKGGVKLYAGDYLSGNDQTFFHIGDINPTGIYNAQAFLTGPLPILKTKLSYYLSLRRYFNDGWLYGQRVFNPTDSSFFENSPAIYLEKTGDNAPVAMNNNSQYFANGKLVFRPANTISITYNFLGDFSEFRNYNHLFRLNPDGDVTNHRQSFTNILNWNHTVSAKTFYTLKFSHAHLNFESYVYEDPRDSRYANPELLRKRADAFSFFSGGANMSHFQRGTTVQTGKFDITSQITKKHQVKAGTEFKYNTIKADFSQAYYKGVEGGGVFDAEAFFKKGVFTHHPLEFAAYLQDKIELDNMIVNAGLRYDYFNANGKVPVDLRDPDNTLRPDDRGFRDVNAKQKLSPRVGIAFPISVRGVFHASYGHFFQIPPYEFLYLNPSFRVVGGGLDTRMGNADLNPQSTVIYEVGFQQGFLDDIGIDVTGFYKDVRNLLGAEIHETYTLGDRYARYINRDYGNIRGITVAVNKRPTASDYLTVSFDYTFQVAEGNASDPDQQFNNNRADPPKKSNIQVVPLNWDQRHTINLSLSYNNPRLFGIGLIGQFQSGLPYTPAFQNRETSFENSGRKPFQTNVDLRFFRRLKLGIADANFFVKVFNLFDLENEINVYTDTGRAGYTLRKGIGAHVAAVNTLDEWFNRPDFYSEPRRVLVGLDVAL